MGEIVYNRETGERAYLDDDGRIMPAEYANPLVQAGRQFADIGSGLQMAYGTAMGDAEMVARAEADTAERNRIFAGTDAADPLTSMIGQALPGIATAPMTGLGTGIVLGAAESALDVGEGGNAAQRAAAGGAGAILGDLGGRILGRVWNAAEGISQALAGRELTANTQAQAFERLGGETLAYQRMTPDTLGQSFAERATQGAQASVWGAPQVKAAFNANEALFNQTAADAVGTPLPQSGLLDDVWRKAAEDRFARGFAEVEMIAQQMGDMQLAGPLRQTLNEMTSIQKLKKFGLFPGLDREGLDQVMTGKEWKIARQALADEAAEETNSEVQGRLYGLIDQLDTVMERKLKDAGPEFTESFSRLRQQYRTYLQLEKPNVINKEGNINIASLNRNLRSGTGYGRTATSQAQEVFPETQALIDLAQAGDKPGFAAFKSSGTAENLSFRDLGRDVQGAVTDGAPGVMGLMLNQAAPLATPLMEAGGGLPYEYLLNRSAPGIAVGAGAGVGRGALDEAFYPFVGLEDERQP